MQRADEKLPNLSGSTSILQEDPSRKPVCGSFLEMPGCPEGERYFEV